MNEPVVNLDNPFLLSDESEEGAAQDPLQDPNAAPVVDPNAQPTGEGEEAPSAEDPGAQGEEDYTDLTGQKLVIPVFDPGTQSEIDTEIEGERLPELVSKGMQYDILYNEYQRLAQVAQQQQALSAAITRDPFLNIITTMRLNGYNEQAILAHLNQQIQQQQPQIEDTNLDPEFQRALDARLEPFKKQQQEMEQFRAQQQRQQVLAHNNQALMQAVQSGGYEYSPDPSYTQKVTQAIRTLYPNVDATLVAFTPEQARAIIREAGLPQKKNGNGQPTQTAAIKKAAAAPRIIGGKRPQGQRPDPTKTQAGQPVSRKDAWRRMSGD
jgi:hypothetical protein